MKITGCGNHMDAAILHEIAWERKIAAIKIEQLVLQHKMTAAHHVAAQRDRKIDTLRGRLRERGFYRGTTNTRELRMAA